MEACVDTGAWNLVINEEIRAKLGLAIEGTELAELADGTIEEYPMTEPVEFRWKDRKFALPAQVIPSASEVLFGALPMESLDVYADPVDECLVGPPRRKTNSPRHFRPQTRQKITPSEKNAEKKVKPQRLCGIDLPELFVYDMVMWEIEFTDEFRQWWDTLTRSEQSAVDSGVSLIEAFGAKLPFPYSSKINQSRHGNMRELRSQCAGRPIHTFYAFDPKRTAILLRDNGSKSG